MKIYRTTLSELKKVLKEQKDAKEEFERKYAEFAKIGKHVVDRLNAEMMTSVVKIVPWGSSNKSADKFSPSYQVVFDFKDDLYVDNDKYKSGSAYIYPSDEFYQTLEQMANDVGLDVLFNNTKSIFWFSIQ